MDDVISLGQLLGVVGDDQMERVNGLKAHPLVVLVPNGLANPASVEEQVVDDGNNLTLEITPFPHLEIKPTLG